ncbi:cox cluster protein [Halogeometricum sp. S1BR25-6]|uniref:Cox cluster protein n=1 Tax=Halogeometricum salsisoli TaxID=2950536 RepID=A0ABU2GCM8_9EURY|nr:DUF6684 family protein [Halogeometricum sp. S1BR25-6]MDS0298221.1 cox cluster protein [Halogeometricum sp. S1BR25-6]
MANEIFDRETLLDLTVNMIPLFIIAFFIAAFAVFPLFGRGDLLAMAVQYGLLLVPFVALAALTYLSGKAIAGDEKRSTVFLQGQATIDEPTELHEYESQAEQAAVDDDSPAELESGDDEATETDDDAAQTDDEVAQTDDETAEN